MEKKWTNGKPEGNCGENGKWWKQWTNGKDEDEGNRGQMGKMTKINNGKESLI